MLASLNQHGVDVSESRIRICAHLIICSRIVQSLGDNDAANGIHVPLFRYGDVFEYIRDPAEIHVMLFRFQCGEEGVT